MTGSVTGTQRASNWEALVARVNQLYHDFQSRQFDNVHIYRHRVERLFWKRDVLPRLVRVRAGLGVDLCTGTGFVPRVLLGGIPVGTRILCMDLSVRALEEARHALGDLANRAEFYAGDATAIPLGDTSAEWVTMNAALHHMPQPQRVLREVDRILKPAGLFCLGHEPNQRFFASPVVSGLQRTIRHTFWYLSPARNLHRLMKRLGWHVRGYEDHEHLDDINQVLISEGLLAAPLTLPELRQAVDTHSQVSNAQEETCGFRVSRLVGQLFPEYRVLKIVYSDYGGETLKKRPLLRGAFDGLMRKLAPRRGMLFSLILQKPDA